MSSLLKSLVEDSATIEKISEDSGDFPMKLLSYKDKVVNDYNRYNVDLNVGIAKIANTDGLNDEQICRIVEEVNNSVYLIKYAALRNFPEREVVFDLAALPRVKHIMVNGEEKVAMEKKASADGLNFLNYTSHEMGNLVPEKTKDLKDILAEKLASESKDLDKEFNSALSKAAQDIYTIAEAIIKYDRAYQDPQEIFGNLCKEANLSKGEQILYKRAIDQKISQLKESKSVPEDYSLNLELVNPSEVNEFSLGKHSMIKVAKHTDTPIITDNGKIIKNVNDLINMATEVKKQKEHISTLDAKKKKLEKR